MGTRIILTVVSLIALCFCTKAPFANGDIDTAWVSVYNGPENGSDYVLAMHLDNAGNLYVAGKSDGGITGSDFTTLKYKPDGTLSWARHYNGPGNGWDEACAIQVDILGNVYVTGYSFGIGTVEDFATLKYDPSGQLLWERRFGGMGAEIPRALAVTEEGNVYVTGGAVSPEGNYVTLKYDTDGVLLWERRYHGPAHGSGVGRAVSIDNSDDVIVTGTNVNSENHSDIVTLKYDPMGTLLWEHRFDGSPGGNCRPNDLEIDEDGTIYIAGYDLDGSPDPANYVTLKIDSLGNLQWSRLYDAPTGRNDIAEAIDVDPSGNVYVTGYSYDSETRADYLTIKYDPDGTVLWERRYNGPGNDTDWAHDLQVDRAGNIVVTGNSVGDGTGGSRPDSCGKLEMA